MMLEASGARAFTRWGARLSKEFEATGLPRAFVLAVTANHVCALEDKHAGEELVAGEVLKSWARVGFKARTATQQWNVSAGVPDDRQLLLLWLPIEAGRDRQLQAAARINAAGGSPGVGRKCMVAKDAPSQRVIDVLDAAGHVRIIGGQNSDAQPSTAPQPSVTQRLQELETLRATGVISDAEHAHKREQIISDM
jgi:hypothetical protein